jgi:hypothetical protein
MMTVGFAAAWMAVGIGLAVMWPWLQQLPVSEMAPIKIANGVVLPGAATMGAVMMFCKGLKRFRQAMADRKGDA